MGKSISSQVRLLHCLLRFCSFHTHAWLASFCHPKTIDTCRQSATSNRHPGLTPAPRFHIVKSGAAFFQAFKEKSKEWSQRANETEERKKWHSKAAEKSWLQSKTLSGWCRCWARGFRGFLESEGANTERDVLKASHKKIKRTANMEKLKWSQVSDSCSHWELETKVRKGIVRSSISFKGPCVRQGYTCRLAVKSLNFKYSQEKVLSVWLFPNIVLIQFFCNCWLLIQGLFCFFKPEA